MSNACLVHRVFSDPGSTSAAGSLALMGEDRALSGHEVPGGEVVQLLGQPFKHLLLRPATSQRYVDESRTDLFWKADVFFDCFNC